MLGGAVGASYVAGVGCLGRVCCDLMFLGGIRTYELSFLSKELRVVGEGSDAIEAVPSGGHGRGSDSNSLLGAVRARLRG